MQYTELDHLDAAIDSVWDDYSADPSNISKLSQGFVLDLLSVACILAELHSLGSQCVTFAWRIAKILKQENPNQEILPDLNTDLYAFEIAI